MYTKEMQLKNNSKKDKVREFWKKDTFELVAKYKFIRAIRPSLKIMLEC